MSSIRASRPPFVRPAEPCRPTCRSQQALQPLRPVAGAHDAQGLLHLDEQVRQRDQRASTVCVILRPLSP